MKLLIDIGNSRLKWALEHDGGLLQRGVCDYRQARFLEELSESWHLLNPDLVALASVGPVAVSELVAQRIRRLWPGIRVLVARSAAWALGVRNAYRQPERLGVDRWLALLAAHRHYPGKVCIVDAGTAITVDVLADGRHLGGLISPGLTCMRKSLQAETAALAFADSQAELTFAADTTAAIASGTLMSALGLIEIVRHQLSADYRLLLTGGDARMLASKLDDLPSVDPDLVFKGLSALADAEES